MSDTRAIAIILYNFQKIIICCTAALIFGLNGGDLAPIATGVCLGLAWYYSGS